MSKHSKSTLTEVKESNYEKSVFEWGTDIGYDKNEIKSTSSGDLVNLRNSIVGYLKSKKLKKRNANFMQVFSRINEELKKRKTIKETEGENDGTHSERVPKRMLSATGISTNSLDDDNEFKGFLKRKTSSTTVLDINIPSFLNDKKQKTSCEEKKRGMEESEVGFPKFCAKGKQSKIKIEFGKGLFENNGDFDPSSDLEPYKIPQKKSSFFESNLKQIELESEMFNRVEEDNFFNLD